MMLTPWALFGRAMLMLMLFTGYESIPGGWQPAGESNASDSRDMSGRLYFCSTSGRSLFVYLPVSELLDDSGPTII